MPTTLTAKHSRALVVTMTLLCLMKFLLSFVEPTLYCSNTASFIFNFIFCLMNFLQSRVSCRILFPLFQISSVLKTESYLINQQFNAWFSPD